MRLWSTKIKNQKARSPSKAPSSLSLRTKWNNCRRAGSDVELTQLVPGTGVDVLALEPAIPRDAKQRPVIVQGASGLGRVVLVAFDLDTPLFTSWQRQSEFWKKLGQEMDIQEVTQ